LRDSAETVSVGEVKNTIIKIKNVLIGKTKNIIMKIKNESANKRENITLLTKSESIGGTRNAGNKPKPMAYVLYVGSVWQSQDE